MPKTFYTEQDIEDMFRRGARSLEVGENVVLTDLAFEKAKRLGIDLVQPHQTPPSAPVRPYVSKQQPSAPTAVTGLVQQGDQLRQRVQEAVAARLGGQVDRALLDTIIQRVLSSVKL
ncbi:MAG: hypothetical protein HPY45_05265 [Anaerolineae bacterium]|nr:hypothetical protein [Anaerolineae bacterium]